MPASSRHEHAMAIFDQVCDLPPEQQATILDEACGEDAVLRGRIESMLKHDGITDRRIDNVDSRTRLAELADSVASAVGDDALPTEIAGYHVLRKIGEGGMGIIYEAEQDAPRRRVALKVLRPGMFSRDLLKRFQREAHVLGQLQHPGIAQIYEAGLTNAAQGQQPFFVMEFIDGQPLDVHAGEQRLSTRQRLELIARVCDALQHAHQKGIIHRDLKPANVMVVSQPTTPDATTGSMTTIDGIGLPKVLDFGIARVTDRDAQHATMQTEVGQLVGTLAYMSPEQLLGDSTDLDTRVDVYALGVMLYELLAEQRPHDLTGLSMPEAARRIQDVEPSRVGVLRRELRGDIETIVAKALDKDRERRYESAAALAADLRRFLAHQPIDARPASAFYQLAKFARRNKGLVAGTGVAIAALVIGLTFATVGLVRAGQENVRARAAEDDANRERESALQAKEEVELVADFQSAVIQSANMEEMGRVILDEIAKQEKRAAATGKSAEINPASLARAVVDASLLSKASATAEARFADKPALQADLHESLSETYFALAMYDQALAETHRTLALRRAHLGDDHPDTVKTIGNVCHVLRNMSRNEEAEPYCREALERRQAALPDHHLNVIEAKYRMALNMLALQRPGAEALLTETHATAERFLEPDAPHLTALRLALSRLYTKEGRLPEALELQRKVYESYVRVHGPDHRATLGAESFIATSLGRLGRTDEALACWRALLKRAERVLGEDDPRTRRVLLPIARLYQHLGENDNARAIYETLLERQRRTLGPDHPRTAKTIAQLERLQTPE